jgi:hypothetical protein
MSDFATGLRISRLTLFSMLLGLLLGSGIGTWYLGQRDPCARYLAGDQTASPTQTVVSGTRTVDVPCTDWTMRQPLAVQVLCLLDMALLVVFVLNGLADVREWMQARRGRQA